jgi:hypothetical protein
MSTPNIAGAAALIQQFFLDGHYHRLIQPTAIFLKAMLIHCADPFPTGKRFPDNEQGFGQLNLVPYLLRTLSINELVVIGQSQHLVTTFAALGNHEQLRVTISSLDQSASSDSWIPLLADLDLIVISPSGRLFRGNHYLSQSEEHFSTTERIIINQSEIEIEIGIYQIHVISNNFEGIETSNFAVIVGGQIDQSVLQFAAATDCVPCGSGSCNRTTLACNCESSGHFGQSCQIVIHEIEAMDTAVEKQFTVQPLESLHLKFTKPSNAESPFNLHIVGDDPIVLRLFIAEDSWPNGIPFKYDRNVWSNESRGTWDEVVSARYVHVMVRNEYSVPWGFKVSATAANPKPGKSLVIAIVVVGVVALALVIGLGIGLFICCRRRRRNQLPLHDRSLTGDPKDHWFDRI